MQLNLLFLQCASQAFRNLNEVLRPYWNLTPDKA